MGRFIFWINFIFIVGGAFPSTAMPDCSKDPLKSSKVCDTTASPPDRAAALVKLMKQEEKLANLVSKAQGAPRIGLPAYNWWSEALHGVAGAPGVSFSGSFSHATSFPMPILIAAAFDDSLVEKVGETIGTEARAFGNNNHSGVDFWTPNINPFRDPRWGRGSETPGEDIARIKGYTEHFLRGLEGNKAERRIIATCKHYAGYDLESWGGVTRHSFDAKITMQDLAEYYMQPFQQCARDSNVGSIMCSYNSINGVPTCASHYLLQTVLREHWNWTASNNYITSDCEAVADVSSAHHYTATNAAGTASCFNAGMDSSCEYSSSSDIPGAWRSGSLNESTVDRALTRLFEGLVRTGYFDGINAQYRALGSSDINSPTAQNLALQTATDGIVMLKNDGTLPLKLQAGSKLAMVGFWADDSSKLRGGYSGNAPYLRTPAYAAQQLGYHVTVSQGPIMERNDALDKWTSDAVSAASKADCIIYFGGLDTSAAAEGSDRTSLAWPAAQVSLVTKLSAVGKPLIVVQMGDQVDNIPLLTNTKVNSILWASWPGQDGGTAVMRIINGSKAPAGRLPVTQYPANYTALPMTRMDLRPNGTNPGRTYRWYPTPVQPFGTGLHYTTFEIGFANTSTSLAIQDLISGCKNKFVDTCPLPSIHVYITNTGNTTSDFVVLAFVAGAAGPEPYPIKTLVSYSRLRNITPGGTVNGTLSWTLGNLARHDSQGNAYLYPGTYTLMLDQPTQVTANLVLTGTATILDQWPVAPSPLF